MQIPDPAFTPALGILAAVMLASVAALGYFLALLRKYVHIVIDVMDNQAWVPENSNGDSGSWSGREVRFSAEDGHPLTGVLVPGETSARLRCNERGAVIFAHEFASDRSIAARYCRPLVDQGFDVLAFDFRGHGGSPPQDGYHPRQWPSDRETADMRGAIRFLSEQLRRQNRPPRIALFGLSRGAGTAILAAHNQPEICAIVADGAYSSDTATEYFMRRFSGIFARISFVPEKYPLAFWKLMRLLLFREYRRRSGRRFPSARKALADMDRMPILFIHGEKDSYIPVAQCQGLYDMAKGPKALWIVPDARHNQCLKIDPESYTRRVVSFLDEHLSLHGFPARTAPLRTRRHEVPIPAPASALVPSLATVHRETATAV